MKKGIIITIILVIIAVVLAIVFVNLFKERDTHEMSSKVISVSQEGYLNEESEDSKTLDSYLDNLIQLGNEQIEAQNFKNVMNTYSLLVDFYAKQIYFTTYNDVYKAEKSGVMDGFSKAEENFKSFVQYVNDHKDQIGDNTTLLERTWLDVRGYALNIMKETNKALSSLQKIYTGCVTSRLANNDFSTVVLSTINTLLQNVENNLSKTNEDILDAKRMINSYLSNGYADLMNYQYDENLKTSVKDILKNGKDSPKYVELVAGTL